MAGICTSPYPIEKVGDSCKAHFFFFLLYPNSKGAAPYWLGLGAGP